MSDLKIQLVHIDGPFKGEIQDYFEPVVSMGRHPDCQLVFPKECTAISRKHAEIIREGDRFKFVDSSANGTLVNGKAAKELFLKDGDVLIFGGEDGPKVSFLSSPFAPGDEEAAAAARAIPANQEVELNPEQPPIPEPPTTPEKPVVQEQEPQKVTPPRFIPPKAMPPVEPKQPQGSAQKAEPEVVAKTFIIQYGATLTSFKQLPITIGSGAECDATLQHPSLAARHAQIYFRDDQYWVKDLTGRGLLTIDRQPVATEAPLPPDSRLTLSGQGPKFQFLGDGRLAEIEETEDTQQRSPAAKKEPRRVQQQLHEEPSKSSGMIWFLVILLLLGGAGGGLYYFQPDLFTKLF